MKQKNSTYRIALLVLAAFISNLSWAGKFVQPWRATTAIVKAGENFDIWFVADAGQSIQSIELVAQYHNVSCTFSSTQGDWEYDALSGNRFNTKIIASVPENAPADRYDLILHTSSGQEISHGGVKVVKEFKDKYYLMHISDGHVYQSGYDAYTLLAKKSEMFKMANIMGCELIVETGDNMYNVRNHPEREVEFFEGVESEGILGEEDTWAAMHLTPGDHEGLNGNAWENGTEQENADFVNDFYGLQNSSFKYGNGRFMMLNNAWDVSKTSANNHKYQCDDAKSWLEGEGSGGNFFLTAGHCYDKMHEFVDQAEPLDLVLAGDKHHVRTNNPYPFNDGSPVVSYVAGSIRDHFEYNLFRIDNEAGTFEAVPGTNAVASVLKSGVEMDRSTWVVNLTLDYENANNGRYAENRATIVNHYNFPIYEARIRFVMPLGADFRIGDNAELVQQFEGDEYQIFDVSIDVPANESVTVFIGDADLCPDDPNKTEPGNCGCGVVEGSCEELELIVNNGSGSGHYYPYEMASIVANDPAENMRFVSWSIESGNPYIFDPTSATTQLRLESLSAEISANYEEINWIDDAVFVSHFVPPVHTDKSTSVEITFENTGNTTWTNHDGYFLKSISSPSASIWGISEVSFDENESILPGEQHTFIFNIQAPDENIHTFQWKLCKNTSSTFGEASSELDVRAGISSGYFDDCDSKTGWTTSGTLNTSTSEKMQGSASLSFVGGNNDEYKKALSTKYSVIGEDEAILQFWYYISDISKIKKKMQVEFGSGGKADTDEYNWNFGEDLREGWNFVRLRISKAGKSGNPDLNSINWFRLYSFKNSSTETKIDGIEVLAEKSGYKLNLNVYKGSGDGSYFSGDVVNISAESPASGKIFNGWTINSGDPQVEDITKASTTLTIGNNSAAVTATYIDESTSINSQSISEIEIFPNPFSEGSLNINFPEQHSALEYKVRILNMTGKTVLEVVANSAETLQLERKTLPENGIYLIIIESDAERFASKLILK